MPRTAAEIAHTEDFETSYELMATEIMLDISERACGCRYAGTSWTTGAEADEALRLLELAPGRRLLDLGAGAGWPGLYFARRSGASVTLLDLPEAGLRLARERAGADGVSHLVEVVKGDAADPPFGPESFDAISHSDLLCCLVEKRRVLDACRRLIVSGGRMVFTVISIAPGLSGKDLDAAISAAPKFAGAHQGYSDMLRDADWTTIEARDITAEFLASCRAMDAAREQFKGALAGLMSIQEMLDGDLRTQAKIEAIERGLIRRELFVVSPG